MPDPDVIERMVAMSTAESGVPIRVTDPVIARRIAATFTAGATSLLTAQGGGE